MKGFATRVPMRRRDNRSELFGSEMEETSRPVGLVRRGMECRAQWTMFIGHRTFARSPGESGSKSASVS